MSGARIDQILRHASWVVAILTLCATGTAGAHESNDCTDLYGGFTAQLVPGPECASPVGFCTRGTLTGDLEGVYEFVMTTSVPAPTAEHPSRETFTGYSTITTAEGVLFADDSGEIWFDGEPGFVTTVVVYGGNECFEAADGVLVATGALDLATGASVGTYVSDICHAQGALNRADHLVECH